MLFNSDVFLRFFAGFLLAYYLVRNRLGLRNLLLVAASYVFYGWWDYRFLGLLLFSSLLDYGVGRALAGCQAPSRRKIWVSLSMVGNLGVLGLFKYYGFFVGSLRAVLDQWGVPVRLETLEVVLPVGISFYTFQTMSYTLDVYRRELEPTRDLIQFLAYVAFFPQLVAGPIERARHLLPQFARTRAITVARLEEGVWLSLWGMFKKVTLADNLAPLVELAFDQPVDSGPLVLMGAAAFGLQIYCDFSGYSDLARGIAKLLGFDLTVNFQVPYAATSVREFWRRWHISLSTWMRDYVYRPLGGNRHGPARTYAALAATLVAAGLWHGAAWTFVVWGLWHACGLVLHRFWRDHSPGARLPGGAGRVLAWLATLLFVFYGWILFRAHSLEQALALTVALGNLSAPSWWPSYGLNLAVLAAPVVAMDWWQDRRGIGWAPWQLPAAWKVLLEGGLLIAVVFCWQQAKAPFIYFQF